MEFDENSNCDMTRKTPLLKTTTFPLILFILKTTRVSRLQIHNMLLLIGKLNIQYMIVENVTKQTNNSSDCNRMDTDWFDLLILATCNKMFMTDMPDYILHEN